VALLVAGLKQSNDKPGFFCRASNREPSTRGRNPAKSRDSTMIAGGSEPTTFGL